MANDLIHDRGRGPELIGTRITVYNLLPDLLQPDKTEEEIGRFYDLEPRQVAAARSYILTHADVVLERHLEIEARIAVGNPPEVIEQAKRTRAALQKYKEWIAQQECERAEWAGSDGGTPHDRPNFKQWLAETQSQPAQSS